MTGVRCKPYEQTSHEHTRKFRIDSWKFLLFVDFIGLWRWFYFRLVIPCSSTDRNSTGSTTHPCPTRSEKVCRAEATFSPWQSFLLASTLR